MAKRVAARRHKAVERDAVKEEVFRELSERLRSAGYGVRRERLKGGYGWKVLSGRCRLACEQYIFVDSALPQNDQIEFLKSKISELGLS